MHVTNTPILTLLDDHVGMGNFIPRQHDENEVAVWLKSQRPSPTPHAASKITRLLVSCAS
jgi:hypothetical protein